MSRRALRSSIGPAISSAVSTKSKRAVKILASSLAEKLSVVIIPVSEW